MMASSKANTMSVFLIAMAIVTVVLPGTKAQPPSPDPGINMAPAPAPSSNCFALLLNMSDCLTFVEAGSNLTKPDKGCCPELAGLVESNPICLCRLLGDPRKSRIKIDLNKAIDLPSACGVNAPPVSSCAAAGIPVGAPMAGEGPSSPGDMTPEGSTESSTSVNENNGSSTATTKLQFFVGLAVVIFQLLFRSANFWI